MAEPRLLVIYRISDQAQCNNPKHKPPYVTKRGCLENMLRCFPEADVWCIADRVSNETFDWLATLDIRRLYRSNFGNGARSFMYGLKLVADLKEDRPVYMVEDDYIHRPGGTEAILDGLALADYVTLFDARDKYVNAGEVDGTGCPGNPLISAGGEVCRVLLGPRCHYKTTNSTCMTCAGWSSTFRADWDVFQRYNSGAFPRDFEMWCDLIQNHSRTLVCPIPGFATHGEVQHLAPFTDWEAEAVIDPRARSE